MSLRRRATCEALCKDVPSPKCSASSRQSQSAISCSLSRLSSILTDGQLKQSYDLWEQPVWPSVLSYPDRSPVRLNGTLQLWIWNVQTQALERLGPAIGVRQRKAGRWQPPRCRTPTRCRTCTTRSYRRPADVSSDDHGASATYGARTVGNRINFLRLSAY